MNERSLKFAQAIRWQGPGWFFGIAVVYFIGWTPLLAQLVVNDRRPAWLIGGLFVAALLAGLWIDNRASLWLRVALLIPYYSLLLFWHIVFGVMASWMDPLYSLLALLLSITLMLPKVGRSLRLYVLVAGTVIAAAICTWEARPIGPWLFVAGLLSIPLGAAFIIWLCRHKRLKHVSGAAMAFFLFSLMIYPRGGVNYKFVMPGLVPEILAQPGVEAIYDYRDPGIAERMCTQVMFLAKAPDANRYLAGPQNPCHYLLRIDAYDSQAVQKIDLYSRGNDNIVFDPQDPNIFYLGTIDEFVRASVEPFKILDRVKLKESIHNLNFLQYDATRDRIFISYDFAPAVTILDRTSLRQVGSIPCPAGARTHDVWIDEPGNQVMVSSTYLIGWRVDTYNLQTLKHKNTYRRPLDLGFHFTTIDPDHRRVFMGSTASGELQVLDLDALTLAKSIQLEPGLRNHNYDAQRGLALVSNYFQGILHIIDSRTLTEVGRLSFGPRLRWVETDGQTGEWYCTSGAGGFRIDPEKVLNHPPADSTQ